MKKTRNLLYIFTLFAFIVACENGANTNKSIVNDDDEKVLRHMKEVLWPKAYAEQDTVLLDKILGDDFKMIDQAGGWYTKKDEIDWIKENAPNYDSFFFEIKRFDILDNGTAIICGTGHIIVDTVHSIYQSSNVLVKREGEWKAVLSHVSGVETLK